MQEHAMAQDTGATPYREAAGALDQSLVHLGAAIERLYHKLDPALAPAPVEPDHPRSSVTELSPIRSYVVNELDELRERVDGLRNLVVSMGDRLEL